MRVVTICVVVVSVLAGAPHAAAADTASASSAPWGYGGPASGAVSRPMRFAPSPQAAPSGAHLTYYGGPVISNVSVESVYWGSANPLDYETGVGPGQTPMTEFLQGVTDSRHLDWLSEYDTPTQHIGRGSYQGQVAITVSPANSGTTISDVTIGNELDHQLTSGALPAPQIDAAGEVKTVYAIFFPDTITLSDNGMVGGEPGGFCAYHSTVNHDGLSVPYMVLPDFDTHGFAQGCGDDPKLFNNFTSVTAHELLESITDPDVNNPGWGDGNLQMEIADLCQSSVPEHGTVVGGNGQTYVVQQEFSNAANECVVERNVTAPASTTYLEACGLASRTGTGFTDAGLAADCLKQYGVALGKADGTFGENDGLVRSQVSSLLARLVELSGATLTQSSTFPDVTAETVPNSQVRNEIELLAGSGIIDGFPDGQFHPVDNLSVAQAVALVTRTLQFIHAAKPAAPDVVDQGSTSADYLVAIGLGLLNPHATNIRGFEYASDVSDGTDRGLLADVLAHAVQQLVDTLGVTPA